MNQLFYNIFNPMEIFFSRDLFADVMSVHNRNMKHARAIEFGYTNLLAMLRPIYTARLCRMRQAYDRPTTWLKSRKRVVGLIYTKQFVS